MPRRRRCRASSRSGSRCISAARSCRTRPYHAAFAAPAELVRGCGRPGTRCAVVDCGGGLGIGYRNEPAPPPAALAGAIGRAFGGLGLRVWRSSRGGGWWRRPGCCWRRCCWASTPASGASCAGRGDERPAAAGDVRCLARDRAGGAGRGRRAGVAGRHGGAGLRDRGHVCARPAAAGAARRTRLWRSWMRVPMVR